MYFRISEGAIGADLTVGPSVTSAFTLSSNKRVAVKGVALHGDGFILSTDAAQKMIEEQPACALVVKPYRNGKDVTGRSKDRFVIDFLGLPEVEARDQFPAPYQHVLVNVKPERDTNRREIRKKNWWLFGETVPALRQALKGLDLFIATVRTSKHRTFVFLDSSVLPESRLVAIDSADAYLLGILSSRAHCAWALGTGAMLEDRPNFSNSEAFDPYPFPADAPEPLKAKIRAEAEALDALRKRVLAEHEDLALTRLYNVLEALRAGKALTEAERDIHDRGLVTLIRQHHDAIDALVAQAYGWPAGLTDEDILTRLVGLNKERASEEAKGLIRWLRPEYQAPDYAAPVTQSFDLDDAAAALSDTIIPWPASLPEQVSAVQSVLSSATAPLAPQDVARAFRGKRAASVRPVLDALPGSAWHDGSRTEGMRPDQSYRAKIQGEKEQAVSYSNGEWADQPVQGGLIRQLSGLGLLVPGLMALRDRG